MEKEMSMQEYKEILAESTREFEEHCNKQMKKLDKMEERLDKSVAKFEDDMKRITKQLDKMTSNLDSVANY